MAQAPMPMPAPSDAAAGAMGGDPMAGAAGDADTAGVGRVILTVCEGPDGGYVIYPGDEPEGGAGDADMSEDDADAMGPAGAASAPNGGSPAPQGQPAASIGEALKLALDIMQSDASSAGAPGDADSQFASGFSADKAPTPATGSPAQRF